MEMFDLEKIYDNGNSLAEAVKNLNLSKEDSLKAIHSVLETCLDLLDDESIQETKSDLKDVLNVLESIIKN